ncbi:uncharacterized protein F54H12.2 [Caerostris extrusa]|uniref:Uncharacterized protein F54H12.2 n=1 Tax=Caerostris extrusa TaxID=172846 RepID=A0AAV4TGA2_CAEEX|nr:uncharacterized protein F54H12.2 [Caerostris extrusa]
MSFYLTLPSDSSLHYFPNNKISSFVTQLPSPITLDGKWEVGLAEIIYPHTWYNVNETNNMFGFDLGDGKLNTRKLSPGSYETIPDILKAMALTSHEGKINFKFNPHTKRVKIKTTDGAKVILEKGLCSMLGFQPQVIENITESSFTADPHTEFPIFYVYSDIVQPVVVGHVEAPLLRVVRISGKDGDVINVLYDRPHYVPVIRQSFQTIEIEIRGVFRRLFRAALPFLVRGGKVVGKEALVTGTKVINDVLSGKDLETAAKSRSKEAGKSLARKAINRVQSMTEDGHWVEFHPLSNVFDGGPVEFHISGSGEEYVDLSQTQLYVKAKIVKADGKPLEKDEKIGPVNLFMHSLFSQMDISLNDRLVSNSSNTYSYRSYFETLLNHGFDCKTSQLTSEMFYKDNNDGLKLRSKFFELSATVDMIGGLHGDLFHQERLLLNLVDVKIKLIRRHAKALENGTAKYPLNRVLCKVYSVPQGSMSFVQDNIFVGQMPKRIIVGCVDNDAFHDESSEPGSHWLAFYCENGCIEFFDSFGNPPDFYDPRFHEITLR